MEAMSLLLPNISQAKRGKKYPECSHMPGISIIRNKTLTGKQTQLAANALESFNYETPVYVYAIIICTGQSLVGVFAVESHSRS